MRKQKISVVIPVYKPEEKILRKIVEVLKKQTVKAEIIENWNMPEAKSMNAGIKKANGDIIVTLDQDCLPENEFWLERLVTPLLVDKKISATVSDLYLPEWYWKKYPFFTRILTINERVVKQPGMDARGCAYRKKDLLKTRLFNEDPKVISIESNVYEDLKKLGKIVHPQCKIYHLHPLNNSKKMKLDYNYAMSNGKVLRTVGLKDRIFWRRILRAIPLIGFFSLIFRFPFRKYFYLFPIYLILIPIQHVNWIYGFWKGFFLFDKESQRNLEVLKPEN